MIEIVAQALIIEAADKLGATGGNWASLVDVRARLASKLSRPEFDAAAKALALAGTATFVPEDNQKTLDGSDGAASLIIGGQRCHLITIH